MPGFIKCNVITELSMTVHNNVDFYAFYVFLARSDRIQFKYIGRYAIKYILRISSGLLSSFWIVYLAFAYTVPYNPHRSVRLTIWVGVVFNFPSISHYGSVLKECLEYWFDNILRVNFVLIITGGYINSRHFEYTVTDLCS